MTINIPYSGDYNDFSKMGRKRRIMMQKIMMTVMLKMTVIVMIIMAMVTMMTMIIMI